MESKLKRLLTPPFIILAALVLWFWEWLWEPLERLMAKIGQWPVLRLLEGWIARTPRYLALACFVIPGAVLLPFKLLGLYFISQGAAFLGIATFLAAKVVGTALVARIFSLTRQQLLEIPWFCRAFGAVMRFRSYIFDTLHRHPAYQRTRDMLTDLRRRLKGVRRGLLFHAVRRWKAVYRRARQRDR
ncbi:hypothetical protein [Dechloromonas sp. HYN0024]|uniref:hypothetical protein n=1 Tax=Dechloromonas sp. HYN0024 TaxID=2231055 RepID=UPI000E42F4AB|nr:hypothetical protein [Dechloromonas sp. HYN0024]AXS80323.1 hypothetical protein HYN24_09995 [Dechloromonas sp. HYN0024]